MPQPTNAFPDFATFFGELYKDQDGTPLTPFPWQERLAERACRGDWPDCIAVPTASGKTAVIDVAVYALAAQADLGDKRTAPRRIFFVVDRRVIVDEAFERAKSLAFSLTRAKSGPLKQVAARLRKLAGDADSNPLECYELRGGISRDNSWVRSPLQPTVICSTVDQIGSRLLFRGYGVSPLVAPVHAAMVGNDSLIVLDEAHCSNPFRQTADAVRRYRAWAEEPLTSPFHFVVMSATPGHEFNPEKVLRLETSDRKHPVLRPRLRASKPTQLIVADNAKGGQALKHLADFVARQARTLVEDDVKAVGIIVNRVATARMIYDELLKPEKGAKSSGHDTLLLTGRMRPYDKDRTIREWRDRIEAKPGRPALDRPVFIVSTQCLEVGANLDFDALVSECASLDALRQRFGRLNRLGLRKTASGVIVIQKAQESSSDDDPIYGKTLSDTWKWLQANAVDGCIDLGIQALDAVVEESGLDVRSICAEQPNAPVMLPAYVDFWVQTAPIPVPDPEVSLFLHGPERRDTDVQVIWRADLDAYEPDQWADVVSLCPPVTQEAMPVQLHVLRRWWRGGESESQDAADVEGTRIQEENETKESPRKDGIRGLVWRGLEKSRQKSHFVDGPEDLSPGDTVVFPASTKNWNLLGYVPGVENDDTAIDIAELVQRPHVVLRVHECLKALWPRSPESPCASWYQRLLDIATSEDPDTRTRLSLHQTLRELSAESDASEEPRTLFGQLEAPGLVVTAYPGDEDKEHWSGMVLSMSKSKSGRNRSFSDEDDTSSAGARFVPLDEHNQAVAAMAKHFAERCYLPEALRGAIERAGVFHDLGKADPRFQAWLFGGNRRRAEAHECLLAKSIQMPRSANEYEAARRKSGYPKGGRHELLSVRLAEQDGVLSDDLARSELILHLIAAHHGHCRPFAPVIADPEPEDVSIRHDGRWFATSSATGLERLDSGVAERFWRMVRRYGWWGAAYLEAVLRLSDWRVSESESDKETTQ